MCIQRFMASTGFHKNKRNKNSGKNIELMIRKNKTKRNRKHSQFASEPMPIINMRECMR